MCVSFQAVQGFIPTSIQKAELDYFSPWEFHNLGLVLSIPAQFKVHREWLILLHIIFFSAAKEWLVSVVCPCCLLGKEYLSSSDRCWHYHPSVLPGSRTQPMCGHGLRGASTTQQRQTAVHRFWMGKIAMVILAKVEDDIIFMVLIYTIPQKNWFCLSSPCQRHKKEGNWQA